MSAIFPPGSIEVNAPIVEVSFIKENAETAQEVTKRRVTKRIHLSTCFILDSDQERRVRKLTEKFHRVGPVFFFGLVEKPSAVWFYWATIPPELLQFDPNKSEEE